MPALINWAECSGLADKLGRMWLFIGAPREIWLDFGHLDDSFFCLFPFGCYSTSCLLVWMTTSPSDLLVVVSVSGAGVREQTTQGLVCVSVCAFKNN